MALTAANDLASATLDLNQSLEMIERSFLVEEPENIGIEPHDEMPGVPGPMRNSVADLDESQKWFFAQDPPEDDEFGPVFTISATKHSGAPNRRFSGNATSS